MLKLCLFIIIFPNLNYGQYCNRTIQEPYTVSVPQTYKKFLKVKTRYVNETAYREQTIVECCSGYKNVSDECLPVCNTECLNGFCAAPKTCQCSVGYTSVRGPNFGCIAICNNCTHGFCLHPNECQCFAGYVKNKNGICSPECLSECMNGYCSAPDECSCFDGYEIIDNEEIDSSQCKPICKSDCENGKCVLPEVCECNEGFQKNIVGNCTQIEEYFHFTTEFDTSIEDLSTGNKSTENMNSGNVNEVYRGSTGNEHLMLIIFLPIVGIVLLSSIFLALKCWNGCRQSNRARIRIHDSRPKIVSMRELLETERTFK